MYKMAQIQWQTVYLILVGIHQIILLFNDSLTGLLWPTMHTILKVTVDDLCPARHLYSAIPYPKSPSQKSSSL